MENETQTIQDAAGTAKSFDFSQLGTTEFWISQWDKFQPTALNILFALLILWVGMKIAKWASNLVRKKAAKAPNIDETLANFFASIVKYIIVALVLITVITQLGVKTTSLVAMLGAATLAIGLALQGTLGNVAAGVMLMLFRPYKLGDYVEVAGHEGVVHDINIFTTVLTTIDNIKVIIANGEAWGSTIQNFTSMGVRRVDVDYGIHYDDDIDKAIGIMKKVSAAHPKVLDKPDAPWAKVVKLNDSSVDIQNRVWCNADDYWDVRFDLNKSIKEAFDKGGITIPYPHQVELDG
ncbi:MAG TPA: mechanosensitive ion channel family protein [Hellea balneolensis]|uniref:Small-conductance mechanosensitive channel n=1 Tax=Hellea balneolensis TaxID=287478 RepID=A0A7C5R0U2_9PROT|nr:mechanosensitive ion channel family protein [Hellea balneolensis]